MLKIEKDAVRDSKCWEIVIKLFSLHHIQKAVHPTFLFKRLQGTNVFCYWKSRVQLRWHCNVYQDVQAYRVYLQTAWFWYTIQGCLWGERSHWAANGQRELKLVYLWNNFLQEVRGNLYLKGA